MVTTICTSTLSFQGNPPFLANNKWGGGSNYGTDISRLQQVVVKPENYKIYFFRERWCWCWCRWRKRGKRLNNGGRKVTKLNMCEQGGGGRSKFWSFCDTFIMIECTLTLLHFITGQHFPFKWIFLAKLSESTLIKF